MVDGLVIYARIAKARAFKAKAMNSTPRPQNLALTPRLKINIPTVGLILQCVVWCVLGRQRPVCVCGVYRAQRRAAGVGCDEQTDGSWPSMLASSLSQHYLAPWCCLQVILCDPYLSALEALANMCYTNRRYLYVYLYLKFGTLPSEVGFPLQFFLLNTAYSHSLNWHFVVFSLT